MVFARAHPSRNGCCEGAPRPRRGSREGASPLMRSTGIASTFLTIILGAATAAGCSGAAAEDGRATDQAASVTDSYAAWRTTRATRQAALDAYVTKNATDFTAFKNA